MLPANRWKIVVNRAVQGHVVRHAVWGWFLYHAITWHCMFAFWYRSQSAAESGTGIQPTVASLYWQFTCMNLPFVCCGLLALPVIAWDLLRQTGRFLGPVVRFRDCLKRLSQGERVTEVRIRSGDYLFELQHSFNEFLSSEFNSHGIRRPEAVTATGTHSPLASPAPLADPSAKLLDEIYAAYESSSTLSPCA